MATSRAHRLWGVMVPIISAGVAVSSGVVSAQAATVPGWRIVQTVGLPGGLSEVMSVSATGANDGWAAGIVGSGMGPSPLLAERWNGSAWQMLPGTAGLVKTGVDNAVVEADSAADAWVFAGTNGSVNDFTDALHWNHGRWTTTRFVNWSSVTSAAVFSPSNAWAFGVVILPKFRLLAERYNGKAWRNVTMPVVPEGTSALGPRDIWAVGPVTPASAKSADAIANWNGTSWRSVRFPRLRLGAGVSIVNPNVVALGRNNVWVASSLGKGMGIFPGALLLHWNGSRWRHVRTPFPTEEVGPLTRDGHGGIWISAFGSSKGLPAYFYHYSHGTWRRVRVPTVPANTTQISSIRSIPGTRSVWAGGEILPSDGSAQGVVLKFGP